jgi:hypothetical protein
MKMRAISVGSPMFFSWILLTIAGWQVVPNRDLEQDDLYVTGWKQRLVDRLHQENQELGLSTEFLYAEDAGGFQDVFATIPAKNRHRLFKVREEYDSGGVFSRLNWSGFKLGF